MRRALVASALALTSAATPSLAADCVLEHAIYRDPVAGFEVYFHPYKPVAADDLVTSAYTITFNGMKAPFVGEITAGLGDYRTEGDARLGCPKTKSGVLSDRQRKACTVWADFVYELGDHDANPLPDGDQPAPIAILLVDFGKTIKYGSDLDLADSGVPGDVFRVVGCSR